MRTLSTLRALASAQPACHAAAAWASSGHTARARLRVWRTSTSFHKEGAPSPAPLLTRGTAACPRVPAGIPNLWPHKDKLLRQIEAKQRSEQCVLGWILSAACSKVLRLLN